MRHDELEQRLWEFEYGLLSAEEAAALREQIATDDDVALLHSHVRNQLALVAEAGRIEAPRIKLRIPSDRDASESETSASGVSAMDAAPRTPTIKPPVQSTKTSPRIRQGANWILGIAASSLIGLLSWATWSKPPGDSSPLARNNAVQDNAVQDNAVQDNAVHSFTVGNNTDRNNTDRNNSDRNNSVPNSPVQNPAFRFSAGESKQQSVNPELAKPDSAKSESDKSESDKSESDKSESDKSESVVIQVNTPARISREAKTPLSVSTKSADGKPQSTELKLRVDKQSGENLFVQDVVTDRFGRAVVNLPATFGDEPVKLKLARTDDSEQGLQLDLKAAKTQYATHLDIDKPRYRPGDVVRYRSVTLSRFGLKADRDVAVEYEMTDPNGVAIAGSRRTGITDHGVGSGELPLEPDTAPGQYTVIARSPGSIFTEVRQSFAVQQPTPRLYDVELSWSDDEYEAGAQAEGKLAVRTPNGEPAKGVKVNVRAYVDGRPLQLSKGEVATDNDGKAAVDFVLPPEIASSEGDFGIQAGAQDVIWKDIPLRADQLQVEFYPEGGDLTAGVENRVYFHCHDHSGKPVTVRGRVLEGADRQISAVATEHDGRGSFRFTPQAGISYTLVVDDPPAIKSRPNLPPVMDQSRIVLDAGPGVFAGRSPIQLKLRSRNVPSEFSLVAFCRGVTVGQQIGTAADFVDGACEMSLPVLDEAAGVLRVTVFDYSKQPPEPMAERLLYRSPPLKLQLEVAGLSPQYATGDAVRGQIITKDESGKPVSAVLGLSAVDETILELADHPPSRMATQFLLLGDVERPEQLEDANFYLSTDPSATVALDLLLGTQGWRRFDRIPADRLAGGLGYAEGLAFDARRRDSEKRVGDAPADGVNENKTIDGFALGAIVEAAQDAPLRFDNREELKALEQLRKTPLAAESLPLAAESLPSAAESLYMKTASQDVGTGTGSPAASRSWVIGLCLSLLLVIGASVVVRQQPTRRVAFSAAALTGCLSVIVLLAFFSTGVWTAQRADVAAITESAISSATTAPASGDKDVDKYYAPGEAGGAPQSELMADPQAAALRSEGLPAGSRPAGSRPVGSRPVGSRPAVSRPAVSAGASPPAAAPAPTVADPRPVAAAARGIAPAKTPAAPLPVPESRAPAEVAPPKPAPASEPVPALAARAQEEKVLPETQKADQQKSEKSAAPGAAGGVVAPPAPATAMRSRAQSLSEAETEKMERLGANKKAVESMKDSTKSGIPSGFSQGASKEALADSPAPNDPAPINPAQSSKSMTGKGTEAAGARKLDRAEKVAPAEPTRDKQLADDAMISLDKKRLVRRYAHLPAIESGDRRGKDFSESVLWDPFFITDEQGLGTFEFHLPDTATRFRILADGHANGRLGSIEQTIQAEPKK